ncbi:putative membrane protein [Waddlia chondrophila 2032/99]|nr:putative membrane protein [Waddlia chondrophila 2032/99]
MFAFLSNALGSHENSVIALILAGLVIGFYKGRFIFAKSVKRVVDRIRKFEEPTSIAKMYSLPYYLLLLSMIGLGMAIKFFQVPMDVRGAIDVAIGAALINGSMLYFRQAR